MRANSRESPSPTVHGRLRNRASLACDGERSYSPGLPSKRFSQDDLHAFSIPQGVRIRLTRELGLRGRKRLRPGDEHGLSKESGNHDKPTSAAAEIYTTGERRSSPLNRRKWRE